MIIKYITMEKKNLRTGEIETYRKLLFIFPVAFDVGKNLYGKKSNRIRNAFTKEEWTERLRQIKNPPDPGTA